MFLNDTSFCRDIVLINLLIHRLNGIVCQEWQKAFYPATKSGDWDSRRVLSSNLCLSTGTQDRKRQTPPREGSDDRRVQLPVLHEMSIQTHHGLQA